MENHLLTNNPFAVLTFMAAPALLTNATSVLALSTTNRILRSRGLRHPHATHQHRGVWPKGCYTRYIVDCQLFRVLQKALQTRYMGVTFCGFSLPRWF